MEELLLSPRDTHRVRALMVGSSLFRLVELRLHSQMAD